jgi:hypothetical protein
MSALNTSGLVLEDYMIAFNGLALGGSTVYNLIEVEGLLDLPDLSSSDQSRTYRHGTDAGFDVMGGRTIIISGDIVSTDTAAIDVAIKALTQAFTPGGSTECELAFQIPGIAGGMKASVFGRCRDRRVNVDRTYRDGLASFIVRVDTTSPYIVSSGTYQWTIDESTAAVTPGVSFPIAFSMGFGGGTPGTQTTVTNSGTVPAEWTAVINGPVVDPVITNQTTGETMTFDITIADGDSLTVDTDNRTVKLNGTTNRYSTFDSASTWFTLPVGDTDLSFTFTSSTGTPTADLILRDTFI